MEYENQQLSSLPELPVLPGDRIGQEVTKEALKVVSV
jgi:isocitrate/isopropylmalate dehydrogenase